MSKVEKHVILLSIDGLAQYYLNDPRVSMPNLREVMRTGASAKSAESIAPSATWAIHTSIATGTYPRKHGVLGNWVYDRANRAVGEHFGERMWSKSECVRRPTLFDEAKARGWTTAAICWPRTRGADTLDWNIPECYDQELFEQYSTPSFWQELKEAGLPVECYGEWSLDHARGPMQDWLTTEVAKYLIRNHRPNLLMMHYLLPDSLQHDYGTSSNEVYWTLEYIDERIGDLIRALKDEGMWEKTDLFVVSDHGFTHTSRTLYPNVLFKQKGWYSETSPADSKVIAMSNGGMGFVYVLEEEAQQREALMNEVRATLRQTEGIGVLFERSEFAALGQPEAGVLDDVAPDFIFEAELDVFVYFDVVGEEVLSEGSKFVAMHGYLPHHDRMKAMFAATGRSIRPGTQLGDIRLVDVAPTIMRLIGGELPDADGRPLDEIWKEGAEIG